MSDYTPTTEEIRAKYTMPECCEVCQIEAAEFDRWLDQVRAEERQRAIDMMDKATFHYGKTHSGRTICQTCDLFLAIQGENE